MTEPKWTMKQIEQRFFMWGKDNCQKAYNENRTFGNGAKTIGIEMGFTTNQIDAMIDTWECYLEHLAIDAMKTMYKEVIK